MAANWDLYQNTNAGQVEWPTGPMALNPGVEPKWIEAWVLQSSTAPQEDVAGTGAIQAARQKEGWQPDYARWTADGPPAGWRNGTFQPGLPAVGIALMSSRNNNTSPPTYEFFWWSDVVVLY
jgi:hypothetical protein